MKTNSFLAFATLATATIATSARAHIDVYLGDALGRNGDQKSFPCDGDPGTGPTFTYAPGATVQIKVNEYVSHPGYFRIAFDADSLDGEDFMEPRSIVPIDKMRQCPDKGDDNDRCKETDFCNTETVLWDNLAPHLSVFPRTADYTWTIKLPDVECEHCTLQVIQVMEDTVHGAYCPWDIASCKAQAGAVQDLYHRCFDIKLEKGAKGGPGETSDSVSLPADKKYVDCSKQESSGPTATSDAGAAPGQTEVDAGSGGEPSEEADAAGDSGSSESSGEVSQKDAGANAAVKDAGAKDAGTTKKDAGEASSAENEEDEPAASSTDSGCALASTREGAAWTLLALGFLLARRERVRR